jgi:hypothetical protein
VPAPTKRRPKGTALPTKKAEVPAWLASAYGIAFENGQPDIPGWRAAISRADAIIKDPAHAWVEHLANLSPELAAARMPAERKAIEQKIRKAKRALHAGQPFPHVESLALSEFLITLDIWHPRDPKEGDLLGRKSLPFVVLCVLAWWQGLLRGNPFEPNVQREAHDLIERRW